MDENKKNSFISKANSLESMGEFWDTHDFTDFDSDTPDVHFEVVCAVPVEIDLFAKIEKQARERGVSIETLVNLWLQQKVSENLVSPGRKYSQRTTQRQAAEKK